MQNGPQPSRRAIFGLALAPILSGSTDLPSNGRLSGLSVELDTIMIALENEGEHDAVVHLLDRMETIVIEMVNIPAKNIKELHAKARATAWAIEHELGIFEPAKEKTTNDKLAASIVRDLLSMRTV